MSRLFSEEPTLTIRKYCLAIRIVTLEHVLNYSRGSNELRPRKGTSGELVTNVEDTPLCFVGQHIVVNSKGTNVSSTCFC